MIDKRALIKDISFKDLINNKRFLHAQRKKNPQYFYPNGLLVFTGMQGQGKTLSAVQYVRRLLLLYPCAKLVTNVDILDFPIDNSRIYRFCDAEDLTRYSNGDLGVIYLIDEIQLYFGSIDRKSVDVNVLTQISQQRKQCKHIVATSQVFCRLAKPLREQFNVVVKCSCYFGFLQINKYMRNEDMVIDKDSAHMSGKAFQRDFFIHSPSMYLSYDTSAIINQNTILSDRKDFNYYDSE